MTSKFWVKNEYLKTKMQHYKEQAKEILSPELKERTQQANITGELIKKQLTGLVKWHLKIRHEGHGWKDEKCCPCGKAITTRHLLECDQQL